MKKAVSIILSFLFVFTCITIPVEATGEVTAKGIQVQYHTQEEIKLYLKNINLDEAATFSVNPQVTSPYQSGNLSEQTQNNALAVLNACRYIAGIDANVGLKEEYINLAQHAALVNAVNKKLSHSPEQPAGMDTDMYTLGKTGASKSNLASASWVSSIGQRIIDGWMGDSDDSNIDRVGHRRWVLNPPMKYTGFGMARNTWCYYAMYAFDGSSGTTDYYGVAWPAQNMPLNFFSNNTAWSISMGKSVDKSSTRVKLVRVSDGKVWNFSEAAADGYFNVENSNYGQIGCIIFRPNNVTYADGDTFSVEITGTGIDVAYTVQFFNPCLHEKTKVSNQKDATCAKEGYTGDIYCSDCGKLLETGSSIEMLPHTPAVDEAVAPTYEKEGKTEGSHCSVCGAILVAQKTVPKLKKEDKQEEPKEPDTSTEEETKNPETILEKGTEFTDNATKAKYIVTSSDAGAPAVTYEGSTDKKVTSIVIPDNVVINGVTYKVTAIKANAFKGNKKVKNITVGMNIVKIGAGAFSGCTKLSSVTLGKSLETIDNNAFYKCTALKKITLPAKLKKIGKKAFYGCRQLGLVTVKTTKLTTKNVGANAFKGIKATAIFKVPKSKLKAYKTLFKAKGAGKKTVVKK